MSLFSKSNYLEKYLGEVKGYLPRKFSKDIADELRSNLAEELDDRQEQLGRQLSDDETIEVLSEHGHPMRVAARYHGATHGLVSTEMFPYYKMAVLSVFFVSVVNLIVFVGLEVFADITISDSSWSWRFINTFMYMLGCVTLGFYVTERILEKKQYLKSWNPKGSLREKSDNLGQAARNLDVSDLRLKADDRASVWGSIFTVVVLLTWLAILNLIPIGTGFDVMLGQTENRFHTLLFWMKGQILLTIALYLVMIVMQEWTFATRVYHCAAELFLVVGCLVTLSIDSATTKLAYPELPDQLVLALNVSIGIFLVGQLIAAMIYGRKAWQIYKNDAANGAPHVEEIVAADSALASERPESDPTNNSQ